MKTIEIQVENNNRTDTRAIKELEALHASAENLAAWCLRQRKRSPLQWVILLRDAALIVERNYRKKGTYGRPGCNRAHAARGRRVKRMKKASENIQRSGADA